MDPTIFRILVINPGSTSTKVAVYDNEKSIFEHVIRHKKQEIAGYDSIIEQHDFRKKVILDMLERFEINYSRLNAVIGRGGLMKPIQGGTYRINERMLEDLHSSAYGQHASSLGGILAHEISELLHIQGFVVDPVVVDEMEELATISGLPEIRRKSLFHALNQKAVARRAAAQLGKAYENCNLIVAHMGGGISVGAHRQGQVVDVNNALDGEGPFSPERSGTLPVLNLVKLCFSGTYTEKEMMKKVTNDGGLMAYLGTNDGKIVSNMIRLENEKALLVYEAMAYQVAKEIGSCSVVLCGQVDGIILTGGLAYDKVFVNWIEQRVSYIAPVLHYPGEDEMIALAQGALRVLRGQEQPKQYA